MAIIKIYRPREYYNFISDYHIFFDGEDIGTISYHETKEVQTVSGTHVLVLKADWCSSQKIIFDIKEEEIKAFTVRVNLVFPIFSGLLLLYFILKSIMNFPCDIFFPISILLVFAYYFTIGKKKYLVLMEKT
jgi:hypothetical protein